MALVKNDDFHFELIASLNNGITASSQLKIGIGVFPAEISLEQVDQQIISVTGLEKVLQKVEVRRNAWSSFFYRSTNWIDVFFCSRLPQVTTSNRKSLEVTLTSKGHGTYQYKLRVLKPLPIDETAFVSVHSPVTRQTLQIPIQPSKVVPKCTTQPFQNMSTLFLNVISNFGLIISALIVLSATIWGKKLIDSLETLSFTKSYNFFSDSFYFRSAHLLFVVVATTATRW